MEFTKVQARQNVVLSPTSANSSAELTNRNNQLQSVLTNVQRNGRAVTTSVSNDSQNTTDTDTGADSVSK